MARTLSLLALLIACSMLSGAASHPPHQDVAKEAVDGAAVRPQAAGHDHVLSPMMQEILTLLEAEQARLPRLYHQFAAATSEDEALAVQEEVEALKRSTEIGVLRIQLRYAREAGRSHHVTRLEHALEEMDVEPTAAP